MNIADFFRRIRKRTIPNAAHVARPEKKYHWAFIGNLSEIQNLYKDFSGADALYWQSVSSGGYTVYDGALRLFSVCAEPESRNLMTWNHSETWKDAYQDILPKNIWCFAEDVFGNQFCFTRDGVCRLDTETGKLERLATTFSEWKTLIDSDVDFHTGLPIASAWHDAHNSDDPLTPDKVLRPVRPFVAGGEYVIANLFPVDAVEAMRFGGHFANRIKDLPDGTQIEFKFTE